MSLTRDQLGAVESVVKRHTGPVMELLKNLKKPASAAGVSPEQLIDMHTRGGAVSGVYLPGGRFMPIDTTHRRGDARIKAMTDTVGQPQTFGRYLKAFADFSTHGPKNQTAAKYLDSLGGVHAVQDRNEFTVLKTALAESSGVTGGYTMPSMFAEQLQMLPVEDAIVEPRATVMPLTSRTLQVPSLDITTNNAPGAVGSGRTNFLGGLQAFWESEAATIGESEPQFRQTVLTAWQLSLFAVASINLLNDEAVGLESLLTKLFKLAMTWQMDYAFLQGIGVGEPLGIINAPATVSVTRAAAGHFRLADVGQMLSHLYYMLSGNRNICWIVHPSVIPELFTMTDNSAGGGNGRLVFQSIDQGAQEAVGRPAGVQSFGTLAGYPVMVSEKLPSLGNTGDVLLVDLGHYLMGKRMEVEIAVSPHVKFQNYQLVWRVVVRGDGQPWLSGPITLADGTFTVSPFVSLHS